jgi:hypothetical protein
MMNEIRNPLYFITSALPFSGDSVQALDIKDAGHALD